MKKFHRLAGKFCLGIVALITVVGPASVSGVGIEELPQSIKSKR